MLRKIGSFECYALAKKYGFYDEHIDLIIIGIQRRVRNRNVPPKIYLGPKPEDYNTYLRTLLCLQNNYKNIVSNLNRITIMDSDEILALDDKEISVIELRENKHFLVLLNRYWGYRHTWYFLQHNPKRRWWIRWLIKYFWQSSEDCRASALRDFEIYQNIPRDNKLESDICY